MLTTKYIVNPDTDNNATIDKGIALIDTSPDSPNSIKAKSVGLQLTLLGLAEIQALRIRNLAVAAYNIEKELYSPEKLQNLDPRKLLSTYEALNSALNEAINYVKGVNNSNWRSIETDLMTLLATEVDESSLTDEQLTERRAVSSLAQDLLAELSVPEDQD
ncbi:conserved hypothetical protein [Vibrio phage 150E35-1]|nr:conserved hypothetical protein [Vibrio phage 150E35-1]